MTELNDAEQIAVKAEQLVSDAKAKKVNLLVLVQKNPQGAVYYHGDKKVLASLLEGMLEDIKSNEFETDGIGSISYGL